MESLGGIQVNPDTRVRTYEDHRTFMLRLAQQLTPEWTDFYPHDPGVVLVESFAASLDILSSYIDVAVGEAHWSSAQRRSSLVNMCDLIGYTPSGPTSSTVDVAVTSTSPVTLYGIDSVGQQPFRIGITPTQGQKQYEFELINETVLNGTQTLSFIEGRTILQETLGSSDGTPGQSFSTSRRGVTNAPDGSYALVVEVFDGATWSEWSNADNNTFFESISSDSHYTYYVTTDFQLVVVFGDGVNGSIPTQGTDNIRITYRIGGGSQSNFVGAERINRIRTPVVGVTTVSNAVSPSGGDDAETREEIRKNAPNIFATGNRVVTQDDYEAVARSVSGVHKVKVARYEQSPLVQGVYVAVTGNNPVPSGVWNFRKQTGTGMLGLVGAALKQKMLSTLKLQVVPITALPIVISVDVHVRRNYSQSQVRANINTAITEFVTSTDSTKIPELIALSEFINALHDVEGVQYVDVTAFHRQPYLEEQVVGYANTTLSSLQLNSTSKDDTFTIRFLDATTFAVESLLHGVFSNVGVVGTLYATDDGSVSFTLTAGSRENKVDDTYTIRVSDYVGNVSVQSHEIPVLTVTPTVTMIGGIPR